MIRLFTYAILVVCCYSFVLIAQESEARITRIEGTANVLKLNAKDWREARVSMPLAVGDQVYSDKESLVEIRYSNGEVLRMDEETKIQIQLSTDKKVITKAPLGTVWVNMKKLTTKGREFEVSSPTAVAAVRGTIFELGVGKDSTTSVSVYNGKVAVGPTDSLKSKIERQKQVTPQEPTEIPGPEEVPGPYEVPLDQWRTIVAGQKISVRTDGKFSSEQFNLAKAINAFVKKNQLLDKDLMK